MKTNLKTLEAINFNGTKYNRDELIHKIISSEFDSTRVYRDNIRKEAAKWLKKYDDAIGGAAVQAWIKMFFDLTEEDLK